MGPKQIFYAAALRPLRSLFVSDAKEGILLIAVAAFAIALANSPLSHAYHNLFEARFPVTPVAKLDTLHLWINDGLMAVFFFVVGLEVKREISIGSLADRASRRLPVIAAIAGMAAPALVYLAIIGDDRALHPGWAIPAATDIAFAMGVIGLLGSRVPATLRLFLLSVAIIDDIGAVIIIAMFYTAQVDGMWLIASIGVALAMAALNLMRTDRLWLYVVLAIGLWLCVLNSGVHATIAGVVAALMIPIERRDGRKLLEPVEHALTPWSAYFIIPLFALANAGVDLRSIGTTGLASPLVVAIAAGLFIGKQAGIMLAVAAAGWLGIARKPDGASWTQLWGVAVLCGIGFTMSLFIGGLAFAGAPHLYEQVKLGVLGGTTISLIAGYLILRLAPGTNGAADEQVSAGH